MSGGLSPEQIEVRRAFHDLAARAIRPRARAIDEEHSFDRELFLEVGKTGFFSMRYPEPEGAGADVLSYVLAVEELAWGSLSLAATCTMQSLMGSFFLHRHLEGEQRRRLLPRVFSGEAVAGICMTEPGAGSDLFSLKTRAEKKGDGWILTGQKTWVTSAPVAEVFTVLARTGDKELSVFLVERGAAGLSIGRAIDKMGVRGSLTSELALDATPALMLGPPGTGMAALREILAEIRVMTGALALGVARAALDDAVKYAKERVQFGKPIGEFQAIQLHLAQMRTELEAARQLVHWAARRSDDKLENADEAAMAKLFASEAAVRVCDHATRILASYGYATDYDVERYLRDARFTLIGGGTSEILMTNIARGMLR
ncbi:MAG: acyl-CoA dehydrogenase family protein [Deltaproteobacteria bacterium]|nr:acyl-CoA dehydrogenase family protein [Deltaproteobacteria bacterium]